MSTLIVVPARIGSTRLPGKMLADVCGIPLIARTYKSTVAANVGDVIVACDDQKIVDAIENIGGKAVLTDPELPSGTDRVYAAWKAIDPHGERYKYIINVQGDLPLIDAEFIKAADRLVKNSNFDMSTLATPIADDCYKLNSVVKPVIAFSSANEGKVLYFSRSPVPCGGVYYHHVGIYCFRINALEKFVSLPQSNLEKIEKLEQLRALENGISIGIATLNLPCPISVDTQEDLDRVRKAAQNM